MTAAVLATVGLGLGACGGGDDDNETAGGEAQDTATVTAPSAVSGSGAKIEVIGKEFSYSPNKLTLKAGQATTIALKNTGAIEHDLTVDDADFKVTVAAGRTADKELKVDKPGTYKFYCSLPGHEDAGMKGELVVE
jgi:uncharacterized cupredoxin-like copper-binding protein